MSNRTIRINELLQREISDILRRRYQSEAVAMTITEVRVAPDLRDARVFVSIVGDEDFVTQKLRWIRRTAPAIRHEVSLHVVLKFLPKFEYILDRSSVRSTRVLQMLDDLGPAPAAEPDAAQEQE
jgi:ribosome-binding factor A